MSAPLPDMPCNELVEVITDYLEGRLPAEGRARFEEHLAGCDGCAAYLEQMRATIAITGRIHEEFFEPRIRERLLAVFKDWKAGR